MNLPPGVPPEALPILIDVGYLEPDRLAVGDLSPRLTLAPLKSGELIEIGRPGSPRPMVLVFGSYT